MVLSFFTAYRRYQRQKLMDSHIFVSLLSHQSSPASRRHPQSGSLTLGVDGKEANLNRWLLKVMVFPMMLYKSESWTLEKPDRKIYLCGG